MKNLFTKNIWAVACLSCLVFIGTSCNESIDVEAVYITAAENAQKDNIPEDCRYTYFARTVVVDGAKYPVISAIPIASSELRIDCAEDKILQLITGEKN